MKAPLIGITTSHNDASSVLSNVYIQAIVRAGGLPVLVPVGYPETALGALRARLDGLLLTGGNDIDPVLFGGQPHPRVKGIDAGRDGLEIALARLAAETRWPLLGICRGAQVLNVALGGGLYTDVGDQLPGALKHDCWDTYPRDYLAHTVTLEPGSRLEAILGGRRVGVNSLHHQGVERIAPGLQAVAVSDDGLVEGLELPESPFALGVQWHPECLPDSEAMQSLFRAFVRSAQQ